MLAAHVLVGLMAALLPPNIGASALPKPLSDAALQPRQDFSDFASYEVFLWDVTRSTPTGAGPIVRTRRVGVQGFRITSLDGAREQCTGQDARACSVSQQDLFNGNFCDIEDNGLNACGIDFDIGGVDDCGLFPRLSDGNPPSGEFYAYIYPEGGAPGECFVERGEGCVDSGFSSEGYNALLRCTFLIQ